MKILTSTVSIALSMQITKPEKENAPSSEMIGLYEENKSDSNGASGAEVRLDSVAAFKNLNKSIFLGARKEAKDQKLTSMKHESL